MARAIKTLILLFWFVMLGLLIQRTYFQPTPVIALGVITEEGIRAGDEWFGIYQQGKKIGYANTRISIEGDAYRIREESEIDILALGKVHRVRTVINAYTSRDFLLKYFDFSLATEQSAMDIKGAVVKKQLVLDIITAGQTRKEKYPLKEPIYLTPNIRPAVTLMGLETGKRFRFPLFNPATMSTDDFFVTVESKETIKVGDSEQTVYKLKQEFQGMESRAWINQDGETLKEESPLGYSLLKETMIEAKKRDKQGPTVDVVSLVKIPSADIPDAAKVVYLKARLDNVPLSGFELEGGRQSLAGNIIEISAPSGTGTFRFPYAGADRAADLRPTALVQSDDPAIKTESAKIVREAGDAREAARLLNTWVYNVLIKQPVVSIPSAVEVLKQRVGDCNEHTTLYTALARAAGIPTRMAAGIVYMKNGFYYHAWPEVWLNEWVAIDPTFNQFPADATHIRFVTGDLSRQADIMKLVGKLKVDVLEYK
ncbi:MAG: transglutaminase-like domain-containing protein [Nitrospirota bacterium]|nr:transglutaminase-like domain-containing protein [Nitrospirota bacterium]